MSEKLSHTVEYFQLLLEAAEKLLVSGQYEQIVDQTFCCYNNLRSGWTPQIDAVFSAPATPEEKRLSERMTKVMLQTVEGLLKTAQPSTEFEGYSLLESIAVQLYRLGDQAPREMVAATRQLIEQSQAMGAPEAMTMLIPPLELLDRMEKPNDEAGHR